MHELSLSNAIVATALRHAGARRVSAVNMRVGSLRQVVPTSLDFYFEIVARDTLCEGARLELELLTAQLRCRGCGREWEPAAGFSFRCPHCGEGGGEILRGDEFDVESIEVEERCIARR